MNAPLGGSRLAALIAAFALCSGCAVQSQFRMQARAHIAHVVIIIQENRSFDNLFHSYPGADSATYGLAHDGTRVKLEPVSLTAPYDMSNGFRDFEQSYDNGKMDGWDLRRVVNPKGVPLNAAQYPQFAYVPGTESEPYFEIAKNYVLADRMFQSNIDQSFVAHLYLIAAQAGSSTNVPSGRPWGCDAWTGTKVLTLTMKREAGPAVFPCFDFRTLGDELNAAAKSWSYYAPRVVATDTWRHTMFMLQKRHLKRAQMPEFGQLWSAYDAIAHDRYGPTWSANVISPPAQFMRDVRAGRLGAVTWIVPDWKDSDHSGSRSDTGPSWIAALVNAIGDSKFWNSSVVLVTWDDSGGWYDHVPPPQLDYDGLGVRVPLLVVSPFAKRGYVSHAQYEFGGIMKFAEEVFSLPSLASSDHRANDLADCFDFSRPPRAFVRITQTRYPASHFMRAAQSAHVPDDQ